MKSKNYTYIILFISLTILSTLVLQVHWNVKNYKGNKWRLINEVQIALDNSVEFYYADVAKNNLITYVNNNEAINTEGYIKSNINDTVFKKHTVLKNQNRDLKKDSIKGSAIIQYKINSIAKNNSLNEKNSLGSIKNQIDSISKKDFFFKNKKAIVPSKTINKIIPNDITSLTFYGEKKSTDSISDLKNLATRIVISMVRDSIDFKKFNHYFKKELDRKNINISYAIQHFKCDSLFDKFNPFKNIDLPLKTISKSTYLPSEEKLELAFSNPMMLILKRSITEIILSFLLSLSAIFCLLYLLRTINKQKKIDEIKNDLISNITHEFKTPITTIATAIEGIKKFNSENDIEKTNRYLTISGNQLKKLEVMVERLLETATLETNQLTIRKEKKDLPIILSTCIEKHQINSIEKTILLQTDYTELFINIDSFHIENVVSNLIDNAIKHGGNQIKIVLNSDKKNTILVVEDNGIGIDKNLKETIFEKFYRIPKGNIHDVKGFGIGLYYSKKIIEKHGGTIELTSYSNPTQFKITLPNEN